ncbi:hypothetical protein AMELA_G00149640 [Ameiurus melas]|uniref:Uncharacterized protein n=1 Tax=Ameiurus melas TaxID=219545 RepID=A0A7J6AH86_AMEME|nr:hypothetical protein AMELA_G00149640 [Ameiurus melas]
MDSRSVRHRGDDYNCRKRETAAGPRGRGTTETTRFQCEDGVRVVGAWVLLEGRRHHGLSDTSELTPLAFSHTYFLIFQAESPSSSGEELLVKNKEFLKDLTNFMFTEEPKTRRFEGSSRFKCGVF